MNLNDRIQKIRGTIPNKEGFDIPLIDLFGSKGIVPGAQVWEQFKPKTTGQALLGIGEGAGPAFGKIAEMPLGGPARPEGPTVGTAAQALDLTTRSAGTFMSMAGKNIFQSPDPSARFAHPMLGADPYGTMPAYHQLPEGITEYPVPEEIMSPAERALPEKIQQARAALPPGASSLERWTAFIEAAEDTYDIGTVERVLLQLPFDIALGTLMTGGLSLGGKALTKGVLKTRPIKPLMKGDPTTYKKQIFQRQSTMAGAPSTTPLTGPQKAQALLGESLQIPWKFEEAVGAAALRIGLGLPIKMLGIVGKRAFWKLFGKNIDDMKAQEIAELVELARESDPEILPKLQDLLELSGKLHRKEIEYGDYVRQVDEFIGRSEGDDKIAAEALRPKIIYHGTPQAAGKPMPPDDIVPTGTKAFHVGTEEAARWRLSTGRTWTPLPESGMGPPERYRAGDIGELPYLNEYFITPRKPYLPEGRVLNEDDRGADQAFIAQLDSYSDVPTGPAPESFGQPFAPMGLNRQTLVDLGYDSVPYHNAVEVPGSVSYIILDPSILSQHKVDIHRVIMPPEGRTTDFLGAGVARTQPVTPQEKAGLYSPQIRYQKFSDEQIGEIIQRKQKDDLGIRDINYQPYVDDPFTANLSVEEQTLLYEDAMGEAARRYAHSTDKDATLARLVRNFDEAIDDTKPGDAAEVRARHDEDAMAEELKAQRVSEAEEALGKPLPEWATELSGEVTEEGVPIPKWAIEAGKQEGFTSPSYSLTDAGEGFTYPFPEELIPVEEGGKALYPQRELIPSRVKPEAQIRQERGLVNKKLASSQIVEAARRDYPELTVPLDQPIRSKDVQDPTGRVWNLYSIRKASAEADHNYEIYTGEDMPGVPVSPQVIPEEIATIKITHRTKTTGQTQLALPTKKVVVVEIKKAQGADEQELLDIELTSGEPPVTKDEWVRIAETIMDDTGADIVQGMSIKGYFTNDPNVDLVQMWRGKGGKGFEIGQTALPNSITRADIEEWNKLYPKAPKRPPITQEPLAEPIVGQRRTTEDMEGQGFTDLQEDVFNIPNESLLDELASARKQYISVIGPHGSRINDPALGGKGITLSTEAAHPSISARVGTGRIITPSSVNITKTRIFRTLDRYNEFKKTITREPDTEEIREARRLITESGSDLEELDNHLELLDKLRLPKGKKWASVLGSRRKHDKFLSDYPNIIPQHIEGAKDSFLTSGEGLTRITTKADLREFINSLYRGAGFKGRRAEKSLEVAIDKEKEALFPASVVDELTEQNYDSIYIPASGDKPGWVHVFDAESVSFPTGGGDPLTPQYVKSMQSEARHTIKDAVSTIDPELSGVDKVQTPISTRITSLFMGEEEIVRPGMIELDDIDLRTDLYGGNSQSHQVYRDKPLTRHRGFTDEAASQHHMIELKRLRDRIKHSTEIIGTKVRPKQKMNDVANLVNEEMLSVVEGTPLWVRLADVIISKQFEGIFRGVDVTARGARWFGDRLDKGHKMIREGNADVLRASMARFIIRNEFVSEITLTRNLLQGQIKRVFGRRAFHGGQFDTSGIEYIGHRYNPQSMTDGQGNQLTMVKRINAQAKVNEEMTFTLKDIFENPGDYKGLTKEMKEVIQATEEWGLAGQQLANSWGVHVKRFNPHAGGAYLATFGKNADDIYTDIDYDFRPMAPGESHKRTFPTLRDRMFREYIALGDDPKGYKDKLFKPEYDMGKILNYSQTYKSNMVGDQAFKRLVGGRSKQDLLRSGALDNVGGTRQIKNELRDAKSGATRASDNVQRLVNERRQTIADEAADFDAQRTEHSLLIKKYRADIENVLMRKNISSDDLKGRHKLMTQRRANDQGLDTVGADDFNTRLGLSNEDVASLQRAHWRLGNAADQMDIASSHYINPSTKRVVLDDAMAAAEQGLLDATERLKKATDAYMQWQPRGIKGNNYEFVGYGVNKWFKAETAKEIRRIRKPAHKYFMGFVPTNPMLLWTQTVLSTDLSQLSYQLPIALAFRPKATTLAVLRFLSPLEKGESQILPSRFGLRGITPETKARRAIDGLRRTSTTSRAKQLLDDPEYAEYVRYSGAIQLTGTGEFSAGVLPQMIRSIPVPGAAASGDFLQGLNDWGFTALDMVRFQQWKNSWRGYAKGFADQNMDLAKAEIHGKILASEVHDWTVPRISRGAVRRGMSESEMASERLLWTSVSMVRKPVEMMGTAANGFAKMFINALPVAAGRGQVLKVSQKERAAMRMGLQLSASISTASVIAGVIEGYHRGLRDEMLFDFVQLRVDPRSSEFWTIFGVRTGGPYRSLGRALASSTFEIGGFQPFGETDIPFGGMFKFFEGRISPPIRAAIDLATREKWDGRAIDADNGLNAWVNYSAWAMGAVSPITFSRFPEAVAEEGARWGALPESFTDADFVVDNETMGESEMGGVPFEMLREWFGVSYYERSPRSELNIAAMVWADENDVEMKPDKDGNMSFYSLSEHERALMMSDETGEGPELAKKLRKRVYQMAEGKIGTYHLQKKLYELEDSYLQSLTDLEASHLMDEDRLLGEAYGEFQDLRKKFYDERSRVFDQMDIDPEDEPLEGTRHHWMWSYRQLFDDSLDGKGEFDHETFGVLLARLKEQWRNDGQDDAWAYVQDQQHLIELKYPDKIQQMSRDIRDISDSGWWDIADPVNVKPAMLDRYPSLSGYTTELNKFLNTDKVHWEDLTTGNTRKSQIYSAIEKMRATVVGPSGSIGKNKEVFLIQNPRIGELLDLYGFSAPGKALRERDRQSADFRKLQAVMTP